MEQDGGIFHASPELRDMALRLSNHDEIYINGGSAMRRSHLGYFRAAMVHGNQCMTVSSFAWTSAASGARFGCPPASRQGWVVAVLPSLARCRVGSLQGGL
jgi:hypothetical protein